MAVRFNLKLVFILLTLFSSFALLEDWKSRGKGLLLALDAREVRLLCLASGYDEEDFWERAKAIGVTAALFQRESYNFVGPPIPQTPAICLVGPMPDVPEGWTQELKSGRLRLAFANALLQSGKPPFEDLSHGGIGAADRALRQAWLERTGLALDRILLAGEIPLSEGLAGLWREVLLRGNRVLVLRLDFSRGVEGNLERLRSLGAYVRNAGYSPDIATDPPRERALSRLERWIRSLSGFGLVIFGPIISVRTGIGVLRSLHARRLWPLASPVLDVALGLLSVSGSAVALGLALYSLLAAQPWRLDLFPAPSGGWAVIFPCMMALISLYAPEFKRGKSFFQDVRRSTGAPFLLAVLGLSFLLFRLSLLSDWEVETWVSRILAQFPNAWWLASRWREIFLGTPCLVMGLWACSQRLEHRGPSSRSMAMDPRPWLLLGLVSPMSVLEVFTRTHMPFELAGFHSMLGGLIGLLLGLGIVGIKSLRRG